MCGIYGAILVERKKLDLGIIRALTFANRQRGKESLGFFNSEFEIFKKGDDPSDVLVTDECTEFLDKSRVNSWFMVGHTRYSTRGKVCDKNSHPFNFGDVIGAHNGIIDAPNEYDVDSEYAIDMLDRYVSDYQKALEDDWGYWTLAWYDRRDDHLYLSMHDNMCAVAKYAGVWYFSSDSDHLRAAFGASEIIELTDGDTVRFDKNGKMQWLTGFTSKLPCSYKQDYRTSGGYSSITSWEGDKDTGWTVDKQSSRDQLVVIDDPEGFVKEYDEEFRGLWEEYSHQYESIG